MLSSGLYCAFSLGMPPAGTFAADTSALGFHQTYPQVLLIFLQFDFLNLLAALLCLSLLLGIDQLPPQLLLLILHELLGSTHG